MNHIKVLDHGYVQFIEAYGQGSFATPTPVENELKFGNDYEVGIIEAARQSTQGSFRGWEQDAKLLEYLYRNKHATPFEFAGMIVEVQAPIFVFREWHRHRTQSYNEMSARYTPLPDLYYEPTVQRLLTSSNSNKQASGADGSKVLDLDGAQWAQGIISDMYVEAENTYQTLLKTGVPKELARCVMPVGHYSRMRASANLRNWLAFITLRCDTKAQWEIRQFAEAVGDILTTVFPRTMELYQQEMDK